ncbi:MAG: stage III sporulation protein AB [Lachnospiraceae bacterium]|nr:stage III sporulation protein AB [Lachnospiraceae bacterium]
MLYFLGIFCIMTGAFGYGKAYMYRQKSHVLLLYRMESIFRLMQSEITYKKQSLPQACLEIGKRMPEKEGEILTEIGRQAQDGSGRGFREIWKEYWEVYLRDSPLELEERRILLEISQFTGYEDEHIQQEMLERQKERFADIRKRKEDKNREQNKLVMTLSLSAGALLILLLL